MEITLFNTLGKLVKAYLFDNLPKGKTAMNISLPNSLSDGVYIMNIKNGEKSISKKIYLQK